MNNFEKKLPRGYVEVKKINALDTKTGIILNAVALVIMAAVVLLGFIPYFTGALSFDFDSDGVILTAVVTALGIFVYIILHELVHGVAYKLLTKQKLTFGFSWSCAFCGVPDIYVSRRVALIALVAPLITFSLLLGGLWVLFFFVDTCLYAAMVIIFAMHLGGCAGDMYVTILLLTSLRDRSLLMRDTGPEQSFYLPKS